MFRIGKPSVELSSVGTDLNLSERAEISVKTVYFSLQNLSDAEETPSVEIHVETQGRSDADLVDVARAELLRRVQELLDSEAP